MELVQYSIMNAPDNALPVSPKQDWITFLKRGHRMTQQEVDDSIKTPEVKLAFERAKLGNLPREVRERYVVEDLQFDRYSDHTNKLVRTAEQKKASEIARKMLIGGMPLEEIAGFDQRRSRSHQAMKTSASLMMKTSADFFSSSVYLNDNTRT